MTILCLRTMIRSQSGKNVSKLQPEAQEQGPCQIGINDIYIIEPRSSLRGTQAHLGWPESAMTLQGPEHCNWSPILNYCFCLRITRKDLGLSKHHLEDLPF